MRFMLANALLLGLAGLFAIAALALFVHPEAPANPLRTHPPCVQLAGGPSPLYGCADRRAYVRQDGRWQDAGPLTPVPPVPAA